MKHLELIHELTRFCIKELEFKREEYVKLVQEEDYSYHSTGYLTGQINILQRILDRLIHYDMTE